MTLTQPADTDALGSIGETTTLAVSYLRVSTKEQASKGGRDEGFSIPAQREANLRKARELNAIIVEEFVDAGESARKADRPDLVRMIEYVKANHVAYCIVHKVDRLARNRADDVSIHLALKEAGVNDTVAKLAGQLVTEGTAAGIGAAASGGSIAGTAMAFNVDANNQLKGSE